MKLIARFLSLFLLAAAPLIPGTPAGAVACGFGVDIGSNRCRGYLTSGTSFLVPYDWSSTNTIEVIGGGGGGTTPTTLAHGGGGGGAYSSISNLALTASTSVGFGVGTGGAAGTAGGDTYFCNSSSNCASSAGTAVQVMAKGGSSGGNTSTGAAGGVGTSGVGTTKVSGGTGGTGDNSGGCQGGGGGGGAGGLNGAGANGGTTSGNTCGGSGGGGGGGGAVGANASGGASVGGAGGNGANGSGVVASTGGTAGSGAGGVGGAGTASSSSSGGGGGGGGNSANGGAGGAGQEWDTTHGSGGGGGGQQGGGALVAGAGGGYGGGGGGGSNTATSGAAAQGLIAITYTPAAATAAKTLPLLRAGGLIAGASGTSGNDAFTKILLHFDGTNGSTTITDSNAGGSAHTWTNHTGSISTTQSKFGGASYNAGSATGWVDTPDSADFAYASSDVTVDCWFYANSAGAGIVRFIFGQSDSSPSAASRTLELYIDTGNKLNGAIYNTSAAVTLITGSTSITHDAWNHAAFVRTGTKLKLFLNGTADATDVNFTVAAQNPTSTVSVGRLGAFAGSQFNGYIDEFRLSVGIARWTANFTPPTAAYGP